MKEMPFDYKKAIENGSKMKIVYFEFYNGKVVDPSILPAYCAILNWRLQVIEVQACFAKSNIERYGEEWFKKHIEKEHHEWTEWKWLKKSFDNYVRIHSLSILFNRNPQIDLPDHYEFHTFWKKDEK